MNEALDLMHQPNQPTASHDITKATLETGAPPVATRGPTGRSKYQHIFEQVKRLEAGEGWVKVPTTPEAHDKDLAHIRTALKRQGLFNPDVVKVSTLGGAAKTALCVFIPEDADLSKRDLPKE